MKLLKLLFLLCISSVFAQVPPNDECSNAEPITVSTSLLTIAANFTNATESLDASCNVASTNNRDLWYQFVMPFDGNLFIDAGSSLNFFTLYNTCGAAEIACSSNDTSFGNLVNGNTYLLRASFQFNSLSSFTVQAFSVATNDECVNRETITLGTSTYLQYTANSKQATESIDASCDLASDNNLDLWYEFVMPFNGNVEITEVAQFQNQTYSIFDACGGSELACVKDRGFFLNLNAGVAYILRVSDKEVNAGTINFRVQAFAFQANNDCANSETIIVNTANSDDYIINLKAASESMDASCEVVSDNNLDLWYDFVMPVNGNLSLRQLSSEKVTLFDACAGNEISCKTGVGVVQFIYGLISGTSYKLRISSTTLVTRTLRIQAFEVAPNDECINSEPITVDTANFTQYSIDTRKATESLDASCETVADDNLDLWYEFTMPVTGNLTISNTIFAVRSTLYDACSGTELDCFNGNGTFFNLAFGTTYKLRVAQKFNDANSVNLRLQAFENLFNDDCATPQSITVEVDIFNDYAGNVSAASQSVASSCEPSSDSFTIQDVWYNFTMPIDGDLEIEDLTTISNTAYYALYDVCGNTDIQCFTNDGVFTNLTAGTTYALKTGLSSSQSGVLSFRIRALSGTLGFEEKPQDVFSIFPNPIKNNFTISSKNLVQIQSISIYDLSGRKVKSIQLNETIDNVFVDVSSLQNAMYILEIKGKKGSLTKRIVKQ